MVVGGVQVIDLRLGDFIEMIQKVAESAAKEYQIEQVRDTTLHQTDTRRGMTVGWCSSPNCARAMGFIGSASHRVRSCVWLSWVSLPTGAGQDGGGVEEHPAADRALPRDGHRSVQTIHPSMAASYTSTTCLL